MNIQEILNVGKGITELGFLLTAIYALVLFVGAKLLLKMVKKMNQAAIEKKGKAAATTTILFESILKVVLYAFVLYLVLTQFTALQSLGKLLLGTSSVLGVAVALAAQESMSNMVGGIFLSLYQPFRVHDLITLPDKNITGRVKEIGMRHTILITLNNTEIVIPNSVMNNAIIENKDSQGKLNNYLTFSISYSSNMDEAMSIIGNEIMKHPLLLDKRSKSEKEKELLPYNVVVIDLADYSIDLRASFFTKDASDGFTMCCDLRKSVKEAFDKAHIDIPYPTSEMIQRQK